MSANEITIPNLKRVEFIWKHSPELVEKATKTLLTEVTAKLEGQSIKEIRKGRYQATDTGRLGQSIFSVVRNSGFVGKIASGVEYANYVHEGTYDYGPNKSSVKVSKNNGKLSITKAKGMKARPFFQEAVTNSEAWVKKRVADTYKNLIESI